MRIVVISLERASQRRAEMARQFDALGLPYEIKEAIDGRRLSAEHLAQVDWEGRRQLGLPPQANGSIANWLTHREVMRDLVDNGPDMMAIIEDDAILAPELSEVLSALEQKRFSFDVVALHRRRLRSSLSFLAAIRDEPGIGPDAFDTGPRAVPKGSSSVGMPRATSLRRCPGWC